MSKELKALAEAATPGPWGWDGPVWGYDAENEAPWLIQERGSDVVITGELQCSEANAAYISAADPATVLSLIAERDALLAERDALKAAQPWVGVEDRLPETGLPVLAFYRNQIGKGRRICAEYLAPKSRVADQLSDPDTESVEYDEEAGEYYWLPGWYERIDNWEEYSHLPVTEGDISHWMPLPAPPALQGEQS
ncbi:MAG TPA: DUF551 domain-containing protein [Pseudomonas sp.]|nr:DUF551 domain-containing protein [Pseudomonas sp.]